MEVVIIRYDDLIGIPMLNGCTIIGDKKFSDYGLVPLSSHEVDDICLEVFGYLL